MDLCEILSSRSGAAGVELEATTAALPGDLETPVSAYLKLESLGAKFLLESAESAGSIGRFTFIGIAPTNRIDIYTKGSRIVSSGGSLWIDHEDDDKPLTALRRILSRLSLQSSVPGMGLLGGLVGFISYDCVSLFEARVRCSLGDDTPLGSFYLVDNLLVFDHFLRRIEIVQVHRQSDPESHSRCESLREHVRRALREPIRLPSLPPGTKSNGFAANLTQSEFERIVEESRRNIFAGEIFQVVPSQVLSGETGASSFEIYRSLRMLNPSPYMFYLDFDDLELIGSSPETLVKLEEGVATVRPIAGTRRRGNTADEDAKLAQELQRDEKERAEHVMLVDLGRNDLGRVSEYGSVKVTDFMRLESFSHVMHLTSTVTGRLSADSDQFDLFRAAFPAGTVSGAPKVRAMELISDFEPTPRGPYAGSVGYFSLSGDMDMCISIRTIVKRGHVVYLQAGAGIVADSVPELEYRETLSKIAALEKAIRMAEEGLA